LSPNFQGSSRTPREWLVVEKVGVLGRVSENLHVLGVKWVDGVLWVSIGRVRVVDWEVGGGEGQNLHFLGGEEG